MDRYSLTIECAGSDDERHLLRVQYRPYQPGTWLEPDEPAEVDIISGDPDGVTFDDDDLTAACVEAMRE